MNMHLFAPLPPYWTNLNDAHTSISKFSTYIDYYDKYDKYYKYIAQIILI